MSSNNDILTFEYPDFPDELIEECKRNRDFSPILFEWYKFVGRLCVYISSIRSDSPAVREIPTVNYSILTGLLNRCSRLMLSVIRLSSNGKHGETTFLLDRCISESAIKIQWLCHKDDTEAFKGYLADGLKKDLTLKDEILRSVENRKGRKLIIEKRMLESIQNYIDLSHLSEEEIISTKKLPNLEQMFSDLEYTNVLYTVIQRMGSHAVHGTWSDLLFYYLVKDGDDLVVQDLGSRTQDVQYVSVIYLVVAAMRDFLIYAFNDDSKKSEFILLFEKIENDIYKIQEMAWDDDFAESD